MRAVELTTSLVRNLGGVEISPVNVSDGWYDLDWGVSQAVSLYGSPATPSSMSTRGKGSNCSESPLVGERTESGPPVVSCSLSELGAFTMFFDISWPFFEPSFVVPLLLIEAGFLDEVASRPSKSPGALYNECDVLVVGMRV